MKFSVYVDGSFSKSEPDVVYGGFIVLLDDKPVLAQRQVSHEPKHYKQNNVGGELVATMTALYNVAILAKKFGVSAEIELYHDYTGIYEFVKTIKPWHPRENNPGAIEYVQAFNKLKVDYPDTIIHFHKVKAHTGVYWNEMVDQLTRNQVGPILAAVRIPDVVLGGKSDKA